MGKHKEIFEKANQNILDCFGGADGGLRYINYLTIMRNFAEQAENDDSGSARLVDIVEKFSSLINTLNR